MWWNIGLFAVFVLSADAANVGDACVKNGANAVCRNIRDCPSAINDIRNRRNPQNCGFRGMDPIVCCPDGIPAGPPPPVGTPAPPPRRTPPPNYVPESEEYTENSPGGDNKSTKGKCSPVPAASTSPKTGQKAWDKCIEYQEQLVYPCVKGVALSGEYSRVDRCGHSADELIVGGVNAAKREFPHMVLLGYGDSLETAAWKCAGTLVSEWFILTAGHCTSDRDGGAVSYAILGALKRSDQVDQSRLYKIKNIKKHPDYNKVPSSKYHDIALLETETKMTLDQFAVPACLHVGVVDDAKASASGWGATKNKGQNADTLQKVTLTKFPTPECAEHFPESRYLKQGFDASTQLCYGDKTKSRDTCQGDSGGPLQVKDKRITCMYTVVGVTSFGGACGVEGVPGIYTRVANYVPWIESVVWPDV